MVDWAKELKQGAEPPKQDSIDWGKALVEPKPTETQADWRQVASTVVRPIAESVGLVGGGIVGGTTGGPLGAGAGGALGYGMGKKLADILDAALGYDVPTLEEGIKETPELLLTSTRPCSHRALSF